MNGAILLILILWIAPIIVSGAIAVNKKRDPFLWGFISLFIGWVGTIIIAVLPHSRPKRCLQCGEYSAEDAQICRACRTPFASTIAPQNTDPTTENGSI